MVRECGLARARFRASSEQPLRWTPRHLREDYLMASVVGCSLAFSAPGQLSLVLGVVAEAWTGVRLPWASPSPPPSQFQVQLPHGRLCEGTLAFHLARLPSASLRAVPACGGDAHRQPSSSCLSASCLCPLSPSELLHRACRPAHLSCYFSCHLCRPC